MMINYETRFEKTYIELEALIAELNDEIDILSTRQLLAWECEDPDLDLINTLQDYAMAYTKLRIQLERHCPFLLLS